MKTTIGLMMEIQVVGGLKQEKRRKQKRRRRRRNKEQNDGRQQCMGHPKEPKIEEEPKLDTAQGKDTFIKC